MRRLMTLASLLVAVPTMAFAQDHHGGGHGGGGPGGGGFHGGGPGGGGGPHGGPGGGGAPHGGPGGGQFHGNPGGDHNGPHGAPQPGGRPGGFDHGGRPGGDRPDGSHPDFHGGRPGGDHGFGDRGGWHGGNGFAGRPGDHGAPGRPNNWRPPHQGWQGGRPADFHRVRARPFVYPRGYGYRRWSVGLLLPRLFYGSNYYYSGWETMGLYPPPPGDRWVRYGPDLLLVNVYTGRIDDAVYGAFY